jgi:hypothetical protein
VGSGTGRILNDPTRENPGRSRLRGGHEDPSKVFARQQGAHSDRRQPMSSPIAHASSRDWSSPGEVQRLAALAVAVLGLVIAFIGVFLPWWRIVGAFGVSTPISLSDLVTTSAAGTSDGLLDDLFLSWPLWAGFFVLLAVVVVSTGLRRLAPLAILGLAIPPWILLAFFEIYSNTGTSDNGAVVFAGIGLWATAFGSGAVFVAAVFSVVTWLRHLRSVSEPTPASAPTTPTPNRVDAGWYPDPTGASELRWWSGTQWADATAGTTTSGTEETPS